MLAAGHNSSATDPMIWRLQRIFNEFQSHYRQNAPILGARPDIQESLQGQNYTGFRHGVVNDWFHSEYRKSLTRWVTETYSRKVRVGTGKDLKWYAIQLGVTKQDHKPMPSSGYFLRLFDDKGKLLVTIKDTDTGCIPKADLIYCVEEPDYRLIHGALLAALK